MRSRSCVIGRGGETFSTCSAMAFASTGPTQIGSTRSLVGSRRSTIGRFVTGSIIRPLIDISTSTTHLQTGVGNDGLAAQAVRLG